jgi:NAD(P)-dependent dehydrogenase (short-subunit alcohol dehydrogenase family)
MNAAVVGRIGTPMDIAMAARFLCSEEASFITATDLKVDGGSTEMIAAQR